MRTEVLHCTNLILDPAGPSSLEACPGVVKALLEHGVNYVSALWGGEPLLCRTPIKRTQLFSDRAQNFVFLCLSYIHFVYKYLLSTCENASLGPHRKLEARGGRARSKREPQAAASNQWAPPPSGERCRGWELSQK